MSRHSESVEQKTLEHGITVRVEYDDSGATESPFDRGDSAVRFVEFSRGYVSDSACGRNERSPFHEPEDVTAWAKENRFICYPVFKYEHSGVAYSVRPFSCPWDSGQAGYLLLSREEWKRKSKSSDSYAAAAIKEFSAWCNGEIYGYVIEDADGETLDSCWGFIGDSDYCLEEGIAAAAGHVKDAAAAALAEREAFNCAMAESMAADRPDLAPQWEA